ncbi:MarR family winged helix-turn-helix transcriptional regulator [Kocuria sp. HSID16901]|uniref:MarR family winged helix-turn-helix transcriptional regulator n=1 Tax=Kocuria sp. HSID16901 TaxID=2419505 RepID=UPI000AE9448D|nr:MarR family transcriptional regulator [Kocuria sp. HSID16901]MCT1368542.1 MarR family transcriptional regulator [Rothia sp. p3-SID1597]
MPHIQEWSISRLMSTAARMLEHNWNRQLQSLGLTHAGVMALDVISREGSLTQAQTAHKVGVQAQTMGKTLTRLEAHGHIARQRSTMDRRSYLLVMTDKGRDALAKATAIEEELAGTGVLNHGELREALEQVIRDLSDTDTMPLTVVNETMESLPLESRWVAEDVASRRMDDPTPSAESLPSDVPAS